MRIAFSALYLPAIALHMLRQSAKGFKIYAKIGFAYKFFLKNKKRIAFSHSYPFFISHFLCGRLVEARGVEPLSESPSVYTSPGAGCCLKFPQAADGSQTAACGSFLIQ